MSTLRTTATSQELLERARQVIPGGMYGHYAGPVSEESPVFFSSASGSRFVDVDGNEFIDWMCAYGPMILGYNHPKVDEAAAAQMSAGNTVSLASPVLIDVAEELVDLIHGVDWALFGKNGADSTNLAVMVARAATGRSKVVTVAGGYHGSSPWMQRADAPGTIADDRAHVLSIPWNDAAAFAGYIDAHPGEIAAFISSPYHHPVFADNEEPADGFWDEIQALCRANDIVLIVDDVRAGFRINTGGSHVHYGFEPDLVCLGKALGNGHPIAALTGVDSLRRAATEVFYTGTQFFNAAPMAAAAETLRQIRAVDAAVRCAETGRRLAAGLIDVASAHGYDLRVTGTPAMPYIRIAGEDSGRVSAAWAARCVAQGAYFLSYHNNFVSVAHDEADLDATFAIADQAFGTLAADG